MPVAVSLSLGESVTGGTVTRWLKKDEAAVNARHEDTADDHCRKHRSKKVPARKTGCQSHVELKGAA